MLPERTAEVWNFLKIQPAMNGFVLLGGSALSLRISHRLSEDLDVAFIGFSLPSARLAALSRTFQTNGFNIVATDDPAAALEFEVAGENLRDYQQDFLVNETVKLSFFTADASLIRVLNSVDSNTVRVASLEELFASKALVCASRSTTRDWFDMRTLIEKHNFTVADIHNVFERAGNLDAFSIAMQRLCSGNPQSGDPGLEPLVDNPPSTEDLAEFFRSLRTGYEIQQASDAALRRLREGMPPPDNRPGGQRLK